MRFILQTVAGYVLALMVACLCIGVTGCPAFERDVKVAADVAVDCGPSAFIQILSRGPVAVVAETINVLPTVAVLLTPGLQPADWRDQMTALHSVFGDAVVCAAEVVARDEAAAAASQPAIAARMASTGPPPSQAWLLGGHFVVTYPPPQQLKAPLYGPGGTVVYVPGHAP
jgi:hypothetical protein